MKDITVIDNKRTKEVYCCTEFPVGKTLSSMRVSYTDRTINRDDITRPTLILECYKL